MEELANSLTHGVGLALSLAGFCSLLAVCLERGTRWHVVACAVYGGSLVLLYGVSTLYHAARAARPKKILRVLDHVCIYLLIAGTYTPFALILLHGAWGWTLLVLVWCFALAGTAEKVLTSHEITARPWPYVATGWVAIIAAKPIWEAMSLGLFLWLISGGLFYMLGILFFARDDKRFFHALWHVFVLAGSFCHYWAVMLYVVPPAT
jgi:hemolysin III